MGYFTDDGNENLKVALFVPSMRGGGAERVMLTLAHSFLENGYSVDLILVSAEGPYLSEVPNNIKVINLNSDRAILSLPKLVKYLNRNKPQYLISALTHTNIIAISAKLIAQVETKILVTEHGVRIGSSMSLINFKKKFMFKIASFMYGYADHIVAVSHGLGKNIAKLIKVTPDKIEVIYNPIFESSKIGETFVERSTEKKVPTILGMGRLTEQKDFPTLIKAFYLLSKKHSAKLVILGDGPDKEKLENLVSSLGLQELISFPGFVENPKIHLERADLFVLSSAWEGFGNVIVEAMSCGCPVVSTNCPSGPEEILDFGKYGELVEVGNEEALSEAMIKTLKKPLSKKELINRAADFSVEKSTDQYIKLMNY